MGFQRARSEDQIVIRTREIIDAAKTIYDTKGYEHLSFTAISELTNFTRPTIYKYFSTKEEILLKILEQETVAWIEDLKSSFKINRLYDLNEITDIWVNNLLANTRLLNVYAILFTTLEKNVTVDVLAHFKKNTFTQLNQIIDLMSQLFQDATEDQLLYTVNTLLVVALGLYPSCNLTKTQIQAMEKANIDFKLLPFEKAYKISVYQTLYALKHGIGFNE